MIQKLLFEVKELNLTMLQSQIYVSGYSIAVSYTHLTLPTILLV